MVSHEFRTPLGIIQSSAEILEDYFERLAAAERQEHLGSIRKNTRLVYIETPTNPMMSISDIQAISRICRRRKVELVVDNTFMSPYFQKPIALGADMVVHSTTKFLNGHSDVVGGAIIASERMRRRLPLGPTSPASPGRHLTRI